jgi:hypothetical protein
MNCFPPVAQLVGNPSRVSLTRMSTGLDLNADGTLISHVDASFTPLLERTDTPKMKSSEIGYPTMVFQVAYRHQSFDSLADDATEDYLSMENSIQVFLGMKIYDDKKFRVLLGTRHTYAENLGNPKVRQRSALLPTDQVTDLKIKIPGKSLLWGCDKWKGKKVPDFVLDVECLRVMLSK